MEMVLHQAESPDSDPVLRGLTAQQGQEKGPVLVGKEDALASVASLDQMVRATGDNDPGESWHLILSRNEGRWTADIFLRAGKKLETGIMSPIKNKREKRRD
jgi:hypothetical protein